MWETWVRPWVKKIPWRRKWQPTPVFLPGQSHGQRSLVGYSPRGAMSRTRLSDFIFIWWAAPAPLLASLAPGGQVCVWQTPKVTAKGQGDKNRHWHHSPWGSTRACGSTLSLPFPHHPHLPFPTACPQDFKLIHEFQKQWTWKIRVENHQIAENNFLKLKGINIQSKIFIILIFICTYANIHIYSIYKLIINITFVIRNI